MPASSSVCDDSEVMDSGTSCSRSSFLRAVTTTVVTPSLSAAEAAAAGAGAAVCDQAGRAAMTPAIARPAARARECRGGSRRWLRVRPMGLRDFMR